MSDYIRFPVFILLLTLSTYSLSPARGRHLVRSQQETVKRVSVETIDRVLDIVFPMKIRDHSAAEEAWILRFKPGYAPVSLIIITKHDRRYDVFESKAADSIEDILNQSLASGHPENPEEMARLIRTQKRSVSIPQAVLSRQLKRLKNIADGELFVSDVKVSPSTPTAQVYLGGTFYELRYISGNAEFKYAALGPEIGDHKPVSIHNIFGWMESLRRTIMR